MEQDGITCPDCNTTNEIGWSFCQQCGKKLPKSPAVSTVKPDPKPSPAVSTVNPDPKAPASLKTVPEKQAIIEASLKTVAEKQPEFEDIASGVSEEPSEPVRPPAASADRPAPAETAASDVDPLSSAPTIVVEKARSKPPSAPSAEPAPPSLAAIASPRDPTQHVHSVSGVLCSQCGYSSNVGSSTCQSCGAPITFGKTKVIASPASAGAARLHLVMEGGQPGEVYELGDETTIGRASGDITFPHDGFMSGRHARIVRRGETFVLVDEGSRNGTFVKIKGEIELKPGDMILVGKQLFRFEE